MAWGVYVLCAPHLSAHIQQVTTRLTKACRKTLRGYASWKPTSARLQKNKSFQRLPSVRIDFTKAERMLSFANPLMMGSMYAAQLAIFIICGRFGILGGNVWVVSKLQMLVSYSMSTLMSFMMLSMIFVMITMSVASAKRISEVLAEKSRNRKPLKPRVRS